MSARLALLALLVLSAGGVSGQEVDARPPGGFEIGAAYTLDPFYNVSGGISRGGELLHNVDLTLAWGGDAFLGISGVEAFLYLLANAGGSVGERTGDWQGASNIEAPTAARLYEAWIQKSWDRGSLRLGLYDLNSEFYASEIGALFINSAQGIGPEFAASGRNGPSIFPVASLAARFRWTPTSVPAYALLGILDAVPGDPDDEKSPLHLRLGGDEGALLVVEAGIATPQGGAAPYRKLGLGVWRYTADFPDLLDPGQMRGGTFGAYAIGEAELSREASDPSQGLSGFVRVGHAHDSVHPVAWSLGGGLAYTGLLPGRDGDQSGLAVAVGIHGSRYLRAQSEAGGSLLRSETALEWTYALNLAPWVQLQPDVQYIINPGMDPDLDHALLIGMRVVIGF